VAHWKSLGKAGSPVVVVAVALILVLSARRESAPKVRTSSDSGALRIVASVDMGGWYWLQWSNHENTTVFPPKTGMILWAYSNLVVYRDPESCQYSLLYWVPPGYEGDGREALITAGYAPRFSTERR
jgi:hypothetical protein